MSAYIDLAAAKTWIAAHVFSCSDWATATDQQKTIALEEASDHIDALLLVGVRYTDTQAREFPRWQELGPVPEEVNFQSDYDFSAVPQCVKDACCLEAVEICKWGGSWRRANQEQGVKSMTIDGVIEQYMNGAGSEGLLSKKARRVLQGWIAGAVEGV